MKNKKQEAMNDSNFDPNKAVDWMLKKLECKNDAALCRKLEIQPPVISKIRHKKLPIGDSLLIRLHEETGIGTKQIKAEIGFAA